MFCEKCGTKNKPEAIGLLSKIDSVIRAIIVIVKTISITILFCFDKLLNLLIRALLFLF